MTAERRVAAPSFATPPVVEVAVSVSFRPLLRVRAIQLVEIWKALYDTEFPRAEEQPPVLMPIESLDAAPSGPQIALQLSQQVPTPRLLVRNDQGAEGLQLQNNWFARNWRKGGPDQPYPHYPALRRSFEANLLALHDYLERAGIGPLQPIQAEITYVDHISDGPNGPDPGTVLTLLSPPPRHGIPEVESIRVGANFLIRHGGVPVGRMYLTADPGLRRQDQARVLVLNFSARGKPLGDGIEGVLAFLDLGHDQVRDLFLNVTRPEQQAEWGRDG